VHWVIQSNDWHDRSELAGRNPQPQGGVGLPGGSGPSGAGTHRGHGLVRPLQPSGRHPLPEPTPIA